MANKYTYHIHNLTDEQNKAVLKKLAFAVAHLLPDDKKLNTDLDKLDASWKKLIENADEIDPITKQTVINALGTYLGELFKEDFPKFEWKLFQDNMGSDLCLYFEHHQKDIAIYPVSSLHKGFESKDSDFLKVYFEQTKEEILKWIKDKKEK